MNQKLWISSFIRQYFNKQMVSDIIQNSAQIHTFLLRGVFFLKHFATR